MNTFIKVIYQLVMLLFVAATLVGLFDAVNQKMVNHQIASAAMAAVCGILARIAQAAAHDIKD